MVGTEAAYHIPNRLGYFVSERFAGACPTHRKLRDEWGIRRKPLLLGGRK
jgi:hypothetical protein